MFYGWKLCMLTFMGNLLLQGSLVFMMNAFMEPLSELHGWTRAQISGGMSFAALFGALSIPLWATLSLYFSVRALMATGAIIGGSCLILLGLTDSLFYFYLFYTLAWASGQAFGGAIGNVLMNQWFQKDKGRAFGLSNVGTSVAGAILPFILLIVIENFNVQVAWISYGIVVLAFAPISWILVRDKPEELGMHIDNIPDSEYIPCKNCPYITWKEVLKNKDVYILGLTLSLSLMVASSVVSQLKPRMVDVGLSTYTSMFFSCLTAFFLAVSKYFWGKSCDKYNAIKVVRLLIVSILLSLMLVFIPPNYFILFIFSMCFGVAAGGVWAVMPAAVAFYFGKESFVFYYRVVSTFVLLKAFGYSMLGFSVKFTGGYNAAYILFCGILVCCLIGTLFLKTTPPYLSKQENHA